ncbi:MAG: VWA domain-containing protein [bacterium]|nr:VWA domain-containing protein [bacterium]
MNERDRRWRLVLGGQPDWPLPGPSAEDAGIDHVLNQLYDGPEQGAGGGKRSGGLGGSSPNVARWLGDIRSYFPAAVVRVMQRDALDRLGLDQMLLEPELLAAVEADVHLVANLMMLSRVIPSKTRDTARQVVARVVEELMRKLEEPMRSAIAGSINRATRNLRPRLPEIDWPRTIRANLKNYQSNLRTIIPEKLIGYGRKRSSLRDVVLCVDQSGSMATSVVYSSIFAAVMASLPAVNTRMVVFDTAVVDLTEKVSDPVDMLFGVQLGGGTDINRALAYCQEVIDRPEETILVLITDLYEGGDARRMLSRCHELVDAGVQLVTLLALDDSGAPCYDHRHAAALGGMGVPAFACSPDLFPGLMAAAIQKRDIAQWAAEQDVGVAGAGEA